MLERSDQHLIKRALKGKKPAWVKLVKRYEASVYHYGLRMTNSNEDALDLMQDVFLSVFRNLHSYRGEAKFKTWLFRIAHHRCVELHRRKKGYVDIDQLPETACDQPNPEKDYCIVETNNQLSMAMKKLPLAQRAVIELKFFEHFTFDEIAGQMGISSNTAKSRLYTALDKLKKIMEVDYVDQ